MMLTHSTQGRSTHRYRNKKLTKTKLEVIAKAVTFLELHAAGCVITEQDTLSRDEKRKLWSANYNLCQQVKVCQLANVRCLLFVGIPCWAQILKCRLLHCIPCLLPIKQKEGEMDSHPYSAHS